MNLLSLLMIVRNDAHLVETALRSIIDGVFDQIVVIDQHSDDETVEVIKAFARQKQWKQPFFKLFVTDGKKIGLPEFHYFAGIDQCDSEYVMVLDADEFLTPEFQTDYLRQILEPKDLDGVVISRLNYVVDDYGADVFEGRTRVGNHRLYEPLLRIYRKTSIDRDNPPSLHRVVALIGKENQKVVRVYEPCIVHRKHASRQIEQYNRYQEISPQMQTAWAETRKAIEAYLLKTGQIMETEEK